jgi:hypothetical protein
MDAAEEDPAERDPLVVSLTVSDSNRLEPGAGHPDRTAFVAALTRTGDTGDLAAEYRLSGPAEQVLPKAAYVLRTAGAGRA